MPEEYEVSLTDYLMVLWKEKWIIIVTFAVAIAAALLAVSQLPAQYQVETSLLIFPPLAQDVAGTSVGTIYSPDTYKRLATAGDLLEAASARAYPDGDGPSPSELRERMTVEIAQTAAGDFPGRFPLHIRVVFRGTSRDGLVKLATAWADTFIERNAELLLTRTAQSYTYLSATFSEVEAELLSLQDELRLHRKAYPEEVLLAEIAALEAVYSTAFCDLATCAREVQAVQAKLVACRAALAREPERLVLQRGPSTEALWNFLGTRPQPRDAAAFSDLVIEEEVINSVHMNLRGSVASAEAQLASLQEEAAHLEQVVAETLIALEIRRATLTDAKAERERLELEIALQEETYRRVGTKLQEARLARAEAAEPIRLVERPVLPTQPIGPRKTMNVAVAGVLGLFLGILLAFVANAIKSRETGAAVEEETQPGSEPLDR